MLAPTNTTVRIFGNGMMDCRTAYALPTNQTTFFDLTVKKEDLDDILASLKLRGRVKMAVPLTFTATNAEDTKLSIDPADPITSLFRSMAGAKVTVKVVDLTGGRLGPKTVPITGRLLGIEAVLEALPGGGAVNRRYVGIRQEKVGNRRISLENVIEWDFDDPTDQSEVEKSLDALYGKVHPGSTIVRFGLKGLAKDGDDEGKVPAVLQWVVPDAAFLMNYRLLISKEGKFRIESWATVHNWTNQPWLNTRVSVVAGLPHTFKSDGAQATKPDRKFVRLVDLQAEGGEVVSRGVKSRGVVTLAAPQMASHTMNYMELESAVAGPQGFQGPQGPDYGTPEFDETETASVGDMQVFTSPDPVDIPANKSGLVYIATRDLDDAKTILHRGKSSRPHRAFKIVNTTDMTFFKGSVMVYQEVETPNGTEEVYMGRAILDMTKPGDDRLVVYATDTTTQVQEQRGHEKKEVVGVRLAKGIGYTNYRKTATSEYTIKNSGSEDVELILDHTKVIAGSEATADNATNFESVEWGAIFRCTVKVPAGAEVVVRIEEIRHVVEQLSLSGDGLNQVIRRTKGDGKLGNKEAIKEVLVLAEQVAAKSREVQEQNIKRSKLNEKAKSARDNLGVLKETDERQKFVQSLHDTSDEIANIDDAVMPKLTTELSDLQGKYNAAVVALAETWGEI